MVIADVPFEEEVEQDNPQSFALPIAFIAPQGAYTPGIGGLYDQAGFCPAEYGGYLCVGSQRLPIPGAGQIANSAGGYAWAVDDWVRLDRFLVLGSEGGTYYIGERDLVTVDPLVWHQFHAAPDCPLGFLCLVARERDRPQLPGEDERNALGVR